MYLGKPVCQLAASILLQSGSIRTCGLLDRSIDSGPRPRVESESLRVVISLGNTGSVVHVDLLLKATVTKPGAKINHVLIHGVTDSGIARSRIASSCRIVWQDAR